MSDTADPAAELAPLVRAGDTAAVRALLGRHPALRRRLDDPLPGFHFDGTALLAAVGEGHRELAEFLLEAGADINQKSHWWAGGFGVLDGDLDAGWVDWLVARGARWDPHSAARQDRLDVLKDLVAKDPAAARAPGGDGQTPLHVARSVAVAEFLLAHGADMNARDVDHESTPAQYLVRDQPAITRLLVKRGATTDIVLGAALGDLAIVRRCLDADPAAVRTSVTDEFFPMKNPRAGGTIYFWTVGRYWSVHRVARDFGQHEVFAELMARSDDRLKVAVAAELGDDKALREMTSRAPGLLKALPPNLARKLPDAAMDERPAVVRMMLEAGWPVGAQGQHGATALHWAAWHGDTALARAILRYGPDVNARDGDYGGTPLSWAHYAAREGWHPQRGDYAGVMQVLRDAGGLPPPED